MLTAQDYIEQGTSASNVLSIAAHLDTAAKSDLAAKVRRIAEEVAAITGVRLYGKRGRHWVANNDNRRARRVA